MIAQFAERLSNIGRTIKLTADKATADQISTAHASAFRLGPITVEPALRQITGTRSETLELRSMQVLVILAMANGRIVSRDDPVRQCWEGRIVGDDPVNRVIGRLRKLANEHGGVALRIETITKVGYRLIGAVALMPSTTPQPLAVDGAHNFTTAAPDRLNAIMMRLTSEAPVAKRATVAELRVSRRAAIARGVSALAVAGGGSWALLKPVAGAASNRIAVMSFSNMSGDPAQTYFSDGIAEELRGALSRIGIQVIGKASTENREIVDRADESAKQAVALMPGSGRPIVMLAEISVNRLDYSAAMCGFEKALATQPSDGFVLAMALNNLTYLSNGLKALALADGFIALDPLNPSAQLIRGICPLLLRRYAAAIEDRPIAADRRPRRPVRRKGCRASVRLGTMIYIECRPRPRGEAAKLIVSLNGKAPTAARPLTTEAV